MRLANVAGMSLSDATKPLLIVSRLVGINPKSNWHKIYTVFILALHILSVSYVWYHYGSLPLKNYYFTIFVSSMQDACRIISLVIILGSTLLDKKRFMVPTEDFATIDQSLKSLNGFMDNNGIIYRLQILPAIYVGLLLIIFGLAGFGFYISPGFISYPVVSMVVIGWSRMVTVEILGVTTDCTFLLTVSIIGERFKEINLIIHRIRKHRSYSRVDFVEVSRIHTNNDVAADLGILREQYHGLWGIANRVNSAYGPHLLAVTMTSLALITSHLTAAYDAIRDGNDDKLAIAQNSIWVLFYTMRMFFLVKTSDSTVTEAMATSVVLHELGMKEDHGSIMKAEIRDFLTQLQMEVRKFNASGFFDIDFTLICNMCAAVCTYLVILIQMGS